MTNEYFAVVIIAFCLVAFIAAVRLSASKQPASKSEIRDYRQAVWFLRHASIIDGPYTACEVRELLMQRQCSRHAEATTNGELWEPVHQIPELIPEALLSEDWSNSWTPKTRDYSSRSS